MLKKVQSFLKEEEGATMVEYALMVALIAVACIGIVSALGTKVGNTFTSVSNKMP